MSVMFVSLDVGVQAIPRHATTSNLWSWIGVSGGSREAADGVVFVLLESTNKRAWEG